MKPCVTISGHLNTIKKLKLNLTSQSSCSVCINVSAKPKSIPNYHQKYKKASLLTTELANIASEASGIHFARRCELIKSLIDHWKRGEEVAI